MAAASSVSTMPVRARSSSLRLRSANELVFIDGEVDDDPISERCPQGQLDLPRIICLARDFPKQRPSK